MRYCEPFDIIYKIEQENGILYTIGLESGENMRLFISNDESDGYYTLPYDPVENWQMNIHPEETAIWVSEDSEFLTKEFVVSDVSFYDENYDMVIQDTEGNVLKCNCEELKYVQNQD